MKSLLKRNARVALAASLSWLLVWVGVLAPIPAHGFVPTNWRAALLTNPFDQTHESITENAVKELDSEFFGITNLTKPMKKAIQELVDADADVDKDQTTSAKHFDGESFPEGQARLVGLLADVQSSLAGKNGAGARLKLGQALHTIQDFYSHSNWIEAGNGSPNAALGRPASSLTRLPASTPTCTSCTPCFTCDSNLTTTELTSGYYGGEDRLKPMPSKCSHGGPLDTSTSGISGGINKDSTVCSISPHATQHAAAASVAKDATKQFIRDIKALVTTSQLKLLLGVGPTLTLVMDTTGSMSDIQASVRAQAIAIVDGRLGTDEEPSKYILAPFNDPSVGPITVTDDPTVFKSAISAIGASGGGDCPEYAMSGILQGLAAADDGGDLFMFTDASAKDSDLAGAASSLATSKDIQIYPMLFGSCSPIDPGFIRIAKESGGQLFFLARSEAGNITKLADAVVRSNTVNILSIGDTFTGASKTYTVPIDSTVAKMTVSASGTTALTVIRPDTTTVAPSDPGVTPVALSTGSILTIDAPPVGVWTITVSGAGDFSLTVTGQSTIDLTTFRFVVPGGRPGHEGYFAITGSPVSGQVLTAEATVDGTATSEAFTLRSKAGATLQGVTLTQGAGVAANEFLGIVTLPPTAFLVYVTGLDALGNQFQRLTPGLIQLQTVAATAPASQDFRPGETITYSFAVNNVGAADTFRFIVTDDRGWVVSTSPPTATLATNGTATVTVQLKAPIGTALGTTDTLTLTAQSNTVTSLLNSATVQSFVTNAVVGQPSATGRVLGKGAVSSGVIYVDVQIANTGTGDSLTTTIANLTFETLHGTGAVTYNSTLSPLLPRSLPALNIGDVTTVRFNLNVPSTVTRFAIVESGTIENIVGTIYNFSISQAVIP